MSDHKDKVLYEKNSSMRDHTAWPTCFGIGYINFCYIKAFVLVLEIMGIIRSYEHGDR